jgi:hypothetical protein
VAPGSRWCCWHASSQVCGTSLGVGGVPLGGGLCSFRFWRWWSSIFRGKSYPTWSAPATATLESIILPPWRRCCGVLTPLAHHSGVKTEIPLAVLDDDGVQRRRNLHGGVIFLECWETFGDAWVDVLGFGRCASAASLLLATCLTPQSLKGLVVSFGSDFLSSDVDPAVAVLAIVVVLVSSGGSPYLVQLGCAAMCGFAGFSCAMLVFLVWFSLHVLCLYRFSASFPYIWSCLSPWAGLRPRFPKRKKSEPVRVEPGFSHWAFEA